jgi:dihydrofolate reductase
MISMIWAEDEQHGIGKQQSIPWQIPDDMAFFRKTTSDNTVIMGRKTFDSIGRALPKRTNIVLTHRPATLPSTVTTMSQLDQLIQFTQQNPDVKYYVMGGAYLYQQMMAFADELLITRVAGTFDCDVFAPTIPAGQFELAESHPVSATEAIPAHTFERWIRI